MALEREQRSIGFERADLEKARHGLVGLGISSVRTSGQVGKPIVTAPPAAPAPAPATTQAPSTALMGLSMLGNLDGMYKHSTYDGITLERCVSQLPGT